MRKQGLKRPVGFWEDKRSLEAVVMHCENFQLDVVLKSGQRATEAIGVKAGGASFGDSGERPEPEPRRVRGG